MTENEKKVQYWGLCTFQWSRRNGMEWAEHVSRFGKPCSRCGEPAPAIPASEPERPGPPRDTSLDVRAADAQGASPSEHDWQRGTSGCNEPWVCANCGAQDWTGEKLSSGSPCPASESEQPSRMVNGVPTCRECGAYSSAQVCYRCSTSQQPKPKIPPMPENYSGLYRAAPVDAHVSALREQIQRLCRDIVEDWKALYQIREAIGDDMRDDVTSWEIAVQVEETMQDQGEQIERLEGERDTYRNAAHALQQRVSEAERAADEAQSVAREIFAPGQPPASLAGALRALRAKWNSERHWAIAAEDRAEVADEERSAAEDALAEERAWREQVEQDREEMQDALFVALNYLKEAAAGRDDLNRAEVSRFIRKCVRHLLRKHPGVDALLSEPSGPSKSWGSAETRSSDDPRRCKFCHRVGCSGQCWQAQAVTVPSSPCSECGDARWVCDGYGGRATGEVDRSGRMGCHNETCDANRRPCEVCSKPCLACEGRGLQAHGDDKPCPRCGGKGRVPRAEEPSESDLQAELAEAAGHVRTARRLLMGGTPVRSAVPEGSAMGSWWNNRDDFMADTAHYEDA